MSRNIMLKIRGIYIFKKIVNENDANTKLTGQLILKMMVNIIEKDFVMIYGSVEYWDVSSVKIFRPLKI